MPITWTCPCGKSLRVADEYAGKRVKCPVCNGVSMAPKPEPAFEVVENTAALTSPPQKPATVRAQLVEVSDEEDEPPKKKRRADQHDEEERPGNKRRDDDDDEDRPRKRRRDDDDEDDRPWKKKTQKKAEQKTHNTGLEHHVLNGGVVGGMLAMLGAVVWFVVGLLNDVLFFYPPILFVIGLVAVIKGTIGGNKDES